MTSNGEREFPRAFLRRCIRINLDLPGEDRLREIVTAHFNDPKVADTKPATFDVVYGGGCGSVCDRHLAPASRTGQSRRDGRAGRRLNVPATPQMTALLSAGSRLVGLTSPFDYLFIAMSVGIVGWYWLGRQGPFRQAAQRGGWRLAVAVLSSLGMLVFGIGIAMDQLVIGIVALIVGGLPAMFLIVNGKPRTPEQ